MGSQVDVVYDPVDSLRREQTLVQASVQEGVVQLYDLVDRPDLAQLGLELVEVRLKHLEQHVVEVVFTELQHLVPCSVGLRKHALYVALLRRLVYGPGAL